MKLTLDFAIPLTIRIDTDTGEVEEPAYLHLDSALSVGPERIFNSDMMVNGGPEYLDEDHPHYKRALEVLDRIELAVKGDAELALEVEPRPA